MNGSECKMKSCIGKMLIAIVVLTIFQFAFEWLVYGVWLMPIYKDTAALWRPMNEMGMCPWCIIRLLTLSVLFSALFCKCKKSMEPCDTATPSECNIGGKHCPIKRSLCFGITLGLLIGVMNASTYLWMPIPGELAIKWLVAGVVEGIFIGAILSCLCKAKKA